MAIEEWAGRRNVAEAVAHLEAAGVPAAPILAIDEAIKSAQAAARSLVTETMHPRLGAIPMIHQPALLSSHPEVQTSPPPMLGQHTAEVLTDLLGYQASKSALQAAGIV